MTTTSETDHASCDLPAKGYAEGAKLKRGNRSIPAQFVQPFVVDAEVMGEFVDDGHSDLVL